MIKFKKMHGNGNDFIVINALTENIKFTKNKIAKLCNFIFCKFNIFSQGINNNKVIAIAMHFFKFNHLGHAQGLTNHHMILFF